MSSFNGDDIFGSGPHRMIQDGIKVDHHMFGFPNVQGSFDVGHGFRWRSFKVTGQLEGTNGSDLQSQIDTIERYYVDRTAGTLVDNFGRSWDDVVIDDFRLTGEIERVVGEETLIASYEAKLKNLKP